MRAASDPAAFRSLNQASEAAAFGDWRRCADSKLRVVRAGLAAKV